MVLSPGDYPTEFEIRGEIILTHEAFQKINEERKKTGNRLLLIHVMQRQAPSSCSNHLKSPDVLLIVCSTLFLEIICRPILILRIWKRHDHGALRYLHGISAAILLAK
jgi:hypothetical protein